MSRANSPSAFEESFNQSEQKATLQDFIDHCERVAAKCRTSAANDKYSRFKEQRAMFHEDMAAHAKAFRDGKLAEA